LRIVPLLYTSAQRKTGKISTSLHYFLPHAPFDGQEAHFEQPEQPPDSEPLIEAWKRAAFTKFSATPGFDGK